MTRARKPTGPSKHYHNSGRKPLFPGEPTSILYMTVPSKHLETLKNKLRIFLAELKDKK